MGAASMGIVPAPLCTLHGSCRKSFQNRLTARMHGHARTCWLARHFKSLHCGSRRRRVVPPHLQWMPGFVGLHAGVCEVGAAISMHPGIMQQQLLQLCYNLCLSSGVGSLSCRRRGPGSRTRARPAGAGGAHPGGSTRDRHRDKLPP